MAVTNEAVSAGIAPAGRGWWRDRATLLTGAAVWTLAAAAWVGVALQAWGARGTGQGMETQSIPAGMPGSSVSLADALAFLGAWGVMMAAMMLPSATPMIALYGTVSRNLSRSGKRVVPLALFAATYLVVWLAFGVPVYAAGAVVDALVRAEPALAGLLPYAVALVLLAAGGYQFSALKRVCLRACQSPLSFLMTRWRSGYAGTLRVGLAHALYCVGCCWGLMAVLVGAGAMGLNWVLLIAAVVFAEKLLPRGEWTARLVGAALVMLGLVVLVQPGLALVLRGQPMAM
jgi:predicted metal-binding membrane protein